MDRSKPSIGLHARIIWRAMCLASLLAGFAAGPVFARQTAVYSVAMRGVALNDALARFSSLSGAGVTFDPALINRKQVYCVIDNAEADDVLRCLLQDTGLDYVQLSSGAYVITASTEKPALYGTLAGIVNDRETGQPLPNAHVLLASASDEFGVVTNPNGQFTLPSLLPGIYLVSTTYMGYRDRTDTLYIPPGSHRFSRIELREEPIVFTPVVIDGLQRRRPIERLDRSILLRNDQLELGTAANSDAVFHQMTTLPGVRVNDLTADAHLQGSDAGEHQFRLDGVPIFLPQSAIGVIGPFSPFAIRSLTVHRSGFDVTQGSHLAGVVAAEHLIEGSNSVDLQVDPMSVNTRALLKKNLRHQRTLNLMVAGRTSIWSLYQQPQFQDALNDWSRPDPFLILAPLRKYTQIDPSFFQNALNVSAIPNTDISFTDLHTAARITLTPFSGLRGSIYSGRNRFAGSLLRDFLGVQARFYTGEPTEVSFSEVRSAPLSLVDDYSWQNDAGQLNYYTLLGQHTLFNIQARASRYSLYQQYRVLESLEEYIEDLPAVGEDLQPGNTVIDLDIPTEVYSDGNTIEEYALENRMEYAVQDHFITFGLESAYNGSRFNLLLPSLISESAVDFDSTTVSDVTMERIDYQSKAWRHSMYLEDRISIGAHAVVETGIRLTYLPGRQTAYAEPRGALRFDGALGERGAFAIQTSGGIYRQFLLQFDISTLNAGALFPSKRIWLPVNDQIRPPLAYHLAQSLLLEPIHGLSFRLEGYAKFHHLNWTLTYIERDDPSMRGDVETLSSLESPQFLTPSHGETLGLSAAVDWKNDQLFFQVMYDFSAIRRRSEALFDNSSTSVPWAEPHRLTTAFEWLPAEGLILSSRLTGVWGRAWGFRQAYYDFFGHHPTTRYQPPYDFGDPDDHLLPPLYQLDLGLAYRRSFNFGEVQLRFDLLNALNRKNVIDWRLIWQDDTLQRDTRYLYARIPSLSLRFRW